MMINSTINWELKHIFVLTRECAKQRYWCYYRRDSPDQWSYYFSTFLPSQHELTSFNISLINIQYVSYQLKSIGTFRVFLIIPRHPGIVQVCLSSLLPSISDTQYYTSLISFCETAASTSSGEEEREPRERGFDFVRSCSGWTVPNFILV